MHYTCRACGWSKIVAPLSDALGPGDFYSACPACHYSPLESRPAGAVLGELAQVANTIERLWKSLRLAATSYQLPATNNLYRPTHDLN